MWEQGQRRRGRRGNGRGTTPDEAMPVHRATPEPLALRLARITFRPASAPSLSPAAPRPSRLSTLCVPRVSVVQPLRLEPQRREGHRGRSEGDPSAVQDVPGVGPRMARMPRMAGGGRFSRGRTRVKQSGEVNGRPAVPTDAGHTFGLPSQLPTITGFELRRPWGQTLTFDICRCLAAHPNLLLPNASDPERLFWKGSSVPRYSCASSRSRFRFQGLTPALLADRVGGRAVDRLQCRGTIETCPRYSGAE